MTGATLDGTGDVFYGEQRVAKVVYRLSTTGRVGRAAGMDGEMHIIEGSPLAIEQRNYILRLADQREVAFFVTALPAAGGAQAYAVGTVGPIVRAESP